MSDMNEQPVYKVIYPAPFPGRGEHVRLVLEEAGVHYVEGTMDEFLKLKSTDDLGDELNTPLYAPPYFQYGDLTLNQTPNILQFLGKQLGLAGDDKDPHAVYRVNGFALTALDGFSNEAHSCHHPLGGNFYYEDQKDESIRSSKDYITSRLPAFLGFFQRVLQGKASGEGPWLYGGRLTYADLVLFQCLDGVKHQFPKAIASAESSEKYNLVFQLYSAVKGRPRIKAYLESDRRKPYGNGIYRYYPELDIEVTE